MRKIILKVAVSLDGFIEGKKGEFDWCFTDQDYGMSAFFKRIDAVFMGRKSYELTQTMQGEEPPPDFPKLREYVFSNTMDKVKEGVVLIKGDIKNEVDKIINSKGKDIWLFGGAELISSLMNLKLVDEVILAVHPVILGGGKPLFKEINERTWLTLTASKIYPNGPVFLTYSYVHSKEINALTSKERNWAEENICLSKRFILGLIDKNSQWACPWALRSTKKVRYLRYGKEYLKVA